MYARMQAKSSAIRYLGRTAMVLGALFVVTVLLAAMPRHNPPSVTSSNAEAQQGTSQGSSAASQETPETDRSHLNIDASDEKASEHAAVSNMNRMHDGPHMHMTATRHHHN